MNNTLNRFHQLTPMGAGAKASPGIQKTEEPEGRLTAWFEVIWFFAMPISSVLIIPAIKGTTPAAILGLVSFLLPAFLYPGKAWRYYKVFALLFGLFLASTFLSQASALSNPGTPISLLILVQPSDHAVGMRLSTVTQSIYLFSAASAFLWAFCFESSASRRGFAWGMWFLLLVGWVEWCGFLATGSSFDFVSNRTFGEEGEGSGSLFQTFQLFGLVVERFKSLTGEPSMFALTALPAVPYFFSQGRKYLASACIISLFFTFSTTAYLGLMLMGVAFGVRWLIRSPAYIFVALAIVVILGGVGALVMGPVLEAVFSAKISGESQSGSERRESFERTVQFVQRAPDSIVLFGVGYGTAREFSLLCTLLVNTGAVGAVAFVLFCGIPFGALMGRENYGFSLAVSILTISSCFVLSVPELSYPSSWVYLGWAWREVFRRRSTTVKRKKTFLRYPLRRAVLTSA